MEFSNRVGRTVSTQLGLGITLGAQPSFLWIAIYCLFRAGFRALTAKGISL
jgi:hypothetical protein